MRKWTLLAGLCLLAVPFATAQDGVKISGLVDVGFVHNFNDPHMKGGMGYGYSSGSTKNLGLYDEKEDSFIPGAAKVMLSKEAAEAGTAGFEITLDFLAQAKLVDQGASALISAASGNNPNETDDVAVRAANIVYKADIGSGLTIKAGKMESVVGKDKIDTVSNPHMTHGLLSALHPLTLVGVRASYPVMENLTAILGVNNGGDQDIDDNNGKSVEAALKYSPTEAISLDLNLNYGPEAVEESDGKVFLLNAIANWDVTEEASVYGELTYGNVENDAAVDLDHPVTALDSMEDLTVVGLGVGGTYWFTDKYGASARYEYVDMSSTSSSSFGTYLWEVTVTGSAKLTEDLLFRLEFRYDKANGETYFYDDGVGAAAGDDAQTILGAQLIYTF
jgi:hypothetical protein